MIDFHGLPTMPPEMLALVRGEHRKQKEAPVLSIREIVRARAAQQEVGAGSYGERALAGELETLSRATKGTRNHALNQAAFSVFQLVDAGELDEVTAWSGLRSTAQQVGLADFEIERTLQSASEGAERNPRPAHRLPDQRVIEARAVEVRPENRHLTEPDDEIDSPGYLELLASHRTLHELWQMPDPVPLVKDRLMLDTLGILWGVPGAKKSFIALDLALCVAWGAWWHRQETAQGPVCYFVGEGLSGLKQRSKAWCYHHKLLQEPPDFHAYGLSFDMMNRSRRKGTDAALIVEQVRPKLIVIDTFHRHSLGANENDSRDIGAILETLDLLRIASGGALVLFIHHARKDGGAERGHSSILGMVDVSVEVVSDDTRTQMTWHKMKDAARPDPMELWTFPVEGTGSIVLTDTPMWRPEQSTEDAIDRKVGVALEWARATGLTVPEIASECAIPEVAVKKALTRLETKGLVQKKGGYGWVPK